jgi:hypothetical protein
VETRELTSERKIKANRVNAQASTGPKTLHGRTRSAKNALRHGLSVPVLYDPKLSEEIEALAQEIAAPNADAEILQLARQVVQTQIDLRRVQSARHSILVQTVSDPYFDTQANRRKKAFLLKHLFTKKAPQVATEFITRFVTSIPQGPEKLAAIVHEGRNKLMAIDRYERRALSRRKIAIRAFDEARRRKSSDSD